MKEIGRATLIWERETKHKQLYKERFDPNRPELTGAFYVNKQLVDASKPLILVAFQPDDEEGERDG